MMRFYRALLHLYPASFRADYGEQMCEAFAMRVGGASGITGGLGAALVAIGDVVPNAIAVHADILGQDCRQAWRSARRAPLFFAGAILTLALGVGANGAVFSILRAVLLQPLPYDHPDRVVMVWRAPDHPPVMASGAIRPDATRRILTSEMVLAWREESKDVLGDVAAIFSWQGNLDAQFDLALSDRAERLRGAFVTPNFFTLLGTHAWRGRMFSASDESAGAPLLVISYGLWQRAFGGDPAVVGRPLTVIVGRAKREPRTFTVVGVLPAAFRFTYPEETEAWALMPWSEVAAFPPRGLAFRIVARLAPRATLQAARTRTAAIRTALDRPNQPPEYRESIRLEPVADWVVGETRPSMLLLGAVALLLLVITCATVANALLVRVTARRRELAMRAALGANPRRLVRQLVTEGTLLSVTGAAVGTLFAALVVPVLRSLVPPSVPRADELGVNIWLLAFAALTAGATTILATLAPAWSGSRFDLVATLKRVSAAASVDRATARWRHALVGFQAAVTTCLLISAVLLLTSFWRLGRVPLGFDGERVVTVEMRLLDAKYRDRETLAAFQDALVSRIRAVPGVLEAGLTSAVPFRGVDFLSVLNRVGDDKPHPANVRTVDSAYFSVMRIGLVRGRVFSSQDGPAHPKVVVISEAYAQEMFGGEDPIGKAIQGNSPLEVIGVVRDVRYASLEQNPNPAIYFPRTQTPSELVCVVARVAGPADSFGPPIRRAVREIDPTLPAMNLTTVDRIISESVAGRRFYTTATTAFAFVALLLTMIGLVVIVSRSVVERRRELAIRGALGATSSRLLMLVVRQGLAPVIVGTVAGLLGAFATASALAQFLFHVAPREPTAYAAVGLLVIAVAAAASVIPARHVTDGAPADVLRAE